MYNDCIILLNSTFIKFFSYLLKYVKYRGVYLQSEYVLRLLLPNQPFPSLFAAGVT